MTHFIDSKHDLFHSLFASLSGCFVQGEGGEGWTMKLENVCGMYECVIEREFIQVNSFDWVSLYYSCFLRMCALRLPALFAL